MCHKIYIYQNKVVLFTIFFIKKLILSPRKEIGTMWIFLNFSFAILTENCLPIFCKHELNHIEKQRLYSNQRFAFSYVTFCRHTSFFTMSDVLQNFVQSTFSLLVMPISSNYIFLENMSVSNILLISSGHVEEHTHLGQTRQEVKRPKKRVFFSRLQLGLQT